MTCPRPTLFGVLAALSLTASAPGGTGFDSGSDGSDGALVVTGNTVFDLSLASPGAWNDPSPVPGLGIYDAERWVVVFKYTTIDIQSGTVTFTNHPSGAPVMWLAQGDVFIGGTVSLDGQNGFATSVPMTYSIPGPGGFAGGASNTQAFPFGPGFGPGGGAPSGGFGAGTYAVGGNGQPYGSPQVQPLIGGSGGSGFSSDTGGAGGGAILIASSSAIELAGQVSARGGSNNFGTNGSGGAIRLVANEISGAGSLRADLSGGQLGRIRLEAAIFNDFTGTSVPPFTFSGPSPVFATVQPRLRATTLGGESVPAEPATGVDTVDVCVNSSTVILEIEAEHIPPGTTVRVYVRPAHGSAFFLDSPPLSGTLAFSTTSVAVNLPAIQSEIQLKATWTP